MFQELVKFEMTLKEMIEEAKAMATTPERCVEEEVALPPAEGSRDGSVVSVIEASPEAQLPEIAVTADEGQPRAPGRGKIQQERALREAQRQREAEMKREMAEQREIEERREAERQVEMDRQMEMERQREMMRQREMQEQMEMMRQREMARQEEMMAQQGLGEEQAPPLEFMAFDTQRFSPPAPPARQTPPQPAPAGVRQQQPAAPARRGGETAGQREERQRSVGSDRYEEIIQTRRRSQSRSG